MLARMVRNHNSGTLLSGRNVKMGQQLWKTVRQFVKKIKTTNKKEAHS